MNSSSESTFKSRAKHKTIPRDRIKEVIKTISKTFGRFQNTSKKADNQSDQELYNSSVQTQDVPSKFLNLSSESKRKQLQPVWQQQELLDEASYLDQNQVLF
ncbi:Hypothetical_protein [Hexamita inflata]|uniref:Hypothetical_protein n=1 Tax=Hexamita inflata TaxID=28002 RepID=A0AA86PVU8_9EUKA|nr:Hypothetical protein HINF_LOCUS33431 [Hexamita inflata]